MRPRKAFRLAFAMSFLAKGMAIALVGAALSGCTKDKTNANVDAVASGAANADASLAPKTDALLRVAAASDLALAFKTIGAAFEKDTGTKVDFSFGSTGLLAKQLEEGAPFDVFAAANVSFVDDVVRSGACLGDSKQRYAQGRIVLWSKDAKTLPRSIEDLAKPTFTKIAIANPEHAPYGKAAKEALTRAGVWNAVQGRIVYGDNIQQTLMYAQSGNVDVAIVALSLVIDPNAGADGGAADAESTRRSGSWVPIAASLHEPLDQALVVCKGGAKGGHPEAARAFVSFVGSEPGRAIMRKYGFLLPGDAPPAR